MKTRLLALFVFAFTLNSFAQTGDEKAVWDRVDALTKAVFGTKDSLAIKELVSDKLTYGHSGGNIEDMPTMVHNAAVSPAVYKNQTTEKVSLFFVNNTAIVRTVFRAVSVDKGTESPLNIALLQVWAKEKKAGGSLHARP